MQPESPESPSPVLHHIVPETLQSTPQYGSHAYTATATSQHGGIATERKAPDLEQTVLSSATGEPKSEPTSSQTGSFRRLSAIHTPPLHITRDRISEYERAFSPATRKNEGPEFEVIRSQRNPRDSRSAIQELPNEVLIHSIAHLSPNDLVSVSLVCRRFHDLVTGPHAWRSAFAQFFPGATLVDEASSPASSPEFNVQSGKREFTRLTMLASWRSEYILRTRLLRSLARGKPVQAPAVSNATRGNQTHAPVPMIMYSSHAYTAVNQLHATFTSGKTKRMPRFIHGADDVGTATSSDPSAGRVDNWGLTDPQTFLQFAERYPGDAQYGLGPGDIVGAPNVMDISQPYGMIYGEGSPGCMVYYRSTDEMRGRFLLSSSVVDADVGIPKIPSSVEATTAVWIAKSPSIPSLTDGLVGMMSASSLGVISAYSLGSSSNGSGRDQRYARGELTARWALCPGVPIIAISVDNEHSLNRAAQNRIWAVALNSLGEVFYLTKFPKRHHTTRGARLDDQATERSAWLTGRTVYWRLAEPSRRVAKIDPYADSLVDGSYTPRSSWNGMCLSQSQIHAETKEIEAYFARKPKDFQRICAEWDMRRKLEVDFAGDDNNNAGENIVVFECGFIEESAANLKRYSRCRTLDKLTLDEGSTPPLTAGSTEPASPLISSIGGSPILSAAPSIPLFRLEDSLASNAFDGSSTPRPLSEEWRTTLFSLKGISGVKITATALDTSQLAILTRSEDTPRNSWDVSNSSSPLLSPHSPAGFGSEPVEIPGQRARLFAAGTSLGSVLLWNIRASVPRSSENVNVVEPLRIIYTGSPEISCIAMSALYVVHGGNDGLVQAWDPLGSSAQPIRTLHSRHSSRARRRLVQAEASVQGVGINMFAAGAICLDPDPTTLRGVVSLGNQLRYWSFSSSAADQYKSHKRRVRHSERGSNNGGERFSGVMRNNIKDYIANEKFELEREKEHRKKESQRFAGRFGTELLGGSEEEMMAYAAMLSQESLEQETRRRTSDTSTPASTVYSSINSSVNSSAWDTANATPAQSPSPRLSASKTDEELDADIAEAIRQSLATSPGLGSYDIPIRQAKPKRRKGSSTRPSPGPSPLLAGASKSTAMNDLEFALQLSLAEQESRKTVDVLEEFPVLSPGRYTQSKGKGKQAE